MSRLRTPEINPEIVYADAREAAEIPAEFRGVLRRMHRAGRTSQAEHREALALLVDLEVITDGMVGHAAVVLDTDQ